MPDEMICGAVYEFTDKMKRTLQGTLISKVTDVDDNTVGTIIFPGYAPEHIDQSSARWGQLRLIGRPASPKVGRPKKKD